MSPTDRYPTRCSAQPALLARVDPVVHQAASSASALDRETVDRFEDEGFVVFDHLLDPETVGDLKREVDRLALDPTLRASERVIIEPESTEVRSIFEVHHISPTIRRLIADPRLVEPVRQLLGSDVYVHQSRVNLKPGFDGCEFAWHSDFETWHAEDGMPRARAVSLSVALTPNYVCNGSLMLIPRSHRTFVATVGQTPEEHYRISLRAQEVGVPDRESLRQLVDDGGIFTVTGDAGSAVLFDCNTMHGSAGNITPYPRCNLFVVYNSVDNALVEPFAAQDPRPTFIASRDFAPVG